MESRCSPRTPRSGRGLWNSYKGRIIDNYHDTGSVGSFILPSPASIIFPSHTSRESSRKILKRVLQFPIPEKFKQVLPSRSEDAKQVVKTPSEELHPIGQQSFYGPSKEYVASPLIKSGSEDSDQGSILKKNPTMSEPNKPGLEKRSIGSRLNKSNVKLKQIKKKKFGINKGVQHAIRKPLKKLAGLKLVKKRAVLHRTKNIYKRKKIAKRLCQADARSESEPSSQPVSIPKLAEKPKKSGKFQVAERDNVKYEIQNGMPVFIIRRSPRKTVMSPNKYNGTVTRKTPAKLFNPSGDNDYLKGSPIRKRLGPCLPSPVKFTPLEPEKDEEIVVAQTGEIIQGLIESLDIGQGDVECVEYNHFVTEDDYANLAAETAMEMDMLNAEDQNVSIGKGSQRHQKLQEMLKYIVSDIPPPTEEEINEGRISPKENTDDDESHMNKRATRTTPLKVFPIFEKGFVDTTRSKGSVKKLTPMNFLTRTEKHDGSLTQTVIDAGQKKVGINHCTVCDFIYTIGIQDEERIHLEKHNFVTGVIKFPGWKSEHSLEEFDDGKIVVCSEDNKRHWSKVKEILLVVDNQLGISSDDTPIRDLSKAYMFLSDGYVAGFLLAEPISYKNDLLSLASSKNGEIPVLNKIRENMVKRTLVGISRIWVSEKFQRKKVATRLVNAMRDSFGTGKRLKASEFAFSHTTSNGYAFATKYLKQPNFITYTTLGNNGIPE